MKKFVFRFFFFKQKTAYEMRISDWSSDVCSSDLVTEMSGADMVVQALVDLGVDTVFGYPGGAVLPIYDALYKHPTIQHILVRHEQAATHAAEGYARSTAKPGVVLVTSGPGATTAVTGIPNALLHPTPLARSNGH